MGVINIVKNVKELYPKYIALIKIGNFYYCYGRDCYIISYLLKYKINILKSKIYSCSFPQNAINKVMSTLEDNKVNYLILDRRNNYEVEEKSDNRNLNTYDKKYELGKSQIGTKMKIKKIYSYLLENSEDKELINQIEKAINGRRKV